jgi:ActR/RegA family two-component response regulator
MTSRLDRILVVDDDAVVRQRVADALQARGLAVVSAAKDREATTCSIDERTSKKRHIRRCDRTYAHL